MKKSIKNESAHVSHILITSICLYIGFFHIEENSELGNR